MQCSGLSIQDFGPDLGDAEDPGGRFEGLGEPKAMPVQHKLLRRTCRY